MSWLGYNDPLRRIPWVVRGLLGARFPGVPRRPRLHVIGHRGAAREFPENTIPSFRRAIELGADAIETDITITRDGRFLLWHDSDPDERVALARQAGAEKLCCTPDVPAVGSPFRRRVEELTFEEMRTYYGYSPRKRVLEDLLDGDSKPAFGIATLEDLFAWIGEDERLRHVYLDVKLEERQTAEARELADVVRRYVQGPGAGGPAFHLLSPRREVAEIFLEKVGSGDDPQLDAYPDFELPGALDFARRLGSRTLSMGAGERWWRAFLAEIAEAVAARERGEIRSVVAWTVNRTPRLKQLVDLGVDGIITDDAPVLRTLIDQPAGATDGEQPAGDRRGVG